MSELDILAGPDVVGATYIYPVHYFLRLYVRDIYVSTLHQATSFGVLQARMSRRKFAVTWAGALLAV